MDKYGWRPATQAEVEGLAMVMDLLRIFHSVADTSLWYRRADVVGTGKPYIELPAYARREELYNADKPGEGYEINQRNVDEWRAAQAVTNGDGA